MSIPETIEAQSSSELHFPPHFKLGVAEADLQIVGEDLARAVEGSQESMWSVFAKNKLPNPIGNAIERFSRWEEDLKWFDELSVKHYRTSVSMSRVMTESGEPNLKAIEWYKNYFSAFRARGISLYVTLYHWELPQYFLKQGGWTNRKVVDLLVRHAEIVFTHLDEFIEEYFVVNEPWCISMLGNYIGKHAPGNQDLKTALAVSHNVLRAIGAVTKKLHTLKPSAKVSTVSIVFPTYGLTTSDEDIAAAKRADAFYNAWYLEPLFYGRYPKILEKELKDYMPEVSSQDLSDIRVGEELHALGLNFYNGEYVRACKRAPYDFECVTPTVAQTNDLGWPVSVPPIYPDALCDVLKEVYHTYKNGGLKRLYVSENGMTLYTPWRDNRDLIDDNRRCLFVKEHLAQAIAAARAKVPVEGYFLWTLMDNFEWQVHYDPRSSFGLIHVDRESMRRIPKRSFYWYKGVIEKLSKK